MSTLLNVGCFPVLETYFEPTANESTAHGMVCHYKGGPAIAMDFEVGDGKLTLWSERYRDRPGTVSIVVRFTSKGESIFSIEPIQFKVFDATSVPTPNLTWQRVEEIRHGKIYRKITELPIKSSIELKASSSGGSTWFRMVFDLEINEQQSFALVIPEFSVNGETNPSRTVSFVQKKGVFIYPLNC